MPQIPFYKHCVKCQKGFSTFDKKKICCNDICEFRHKAIISSRNSDIGQKTKQSKKCKGCGINFIPTHGLDYCNAYCLHETRRKRSKVKYAIERESRRTTKKCPECQEEFETYDKNVKYCCSNCNKAVYKRSLEKLRAETKILNEKLGKKKRKIPYHVLNMMAERKRLDEEWNRLTH